MYQSPEKKKVTKRYCRTHKIHFHHECVYCEVEKYKTLGLKVGVVELGG